MITRIARLVLHAVSRADAVVPCRVPRDGAATAIFLATCFFLGAPSAMAAQTRDVLILFTNNRLVPANIALDSALREVVAQPAGWDVELFSEFLDRPAFSGPAFEKTIATYLREKYVDRPPEVILAVGLPALQFQLRQRAWLFPGVPVVYLSINKSDIQAIQPLPADVVGVPVEYDYSGTIQLALRWHPNARRLLVVTGASARDREYEAYARTGLARVEKLPRVEFLSGLATDAVVKRLGELGGGDVVFTPGYFMDGAGRGSIPRESVVLMAASSGAPIYSPFHTHIGTGVVGGHMPSFIEMGREAGKAVNALLDGAPPATLRLPASIAAQVQLDWRQARKWGIREADVPADAIVHFRGPTFWEANRVKVFIAVAVILFQAMLIAGLLVQRSRRRRIESDLRESEARFRATADSAPVMIWMSGVDGRREYFNKGWLDYTGRSVDEERGDGWTESVHPDDLQRYVRTYESAFNIQQPFELEYRLRRHDGEYRWMLGRGVPRYATDGKFLGYTGSSLDITDRKRADEVNQHLAHVSRLAVVGELTAAIAHEINQPLGAIRSNADAAEMLLESGPERLAEVRQILDDIRRDDVRASEVVRRIRGLLQKHEPEIEPYDLNEVVRDCIRMVSSDAARRGVAFETDVTALPILYGDRVQVQQVLLNLILNGMDALESTPRAKSRIAIRTARGHNGTAEVAVADSGKGIPPEQLPRIFDSFYTTKKEGMGLGLAIARFIVESQGGRIWAESGKGSGATFRVELPLGRRETRA